MGPCAKIQNRFRVVNGPDVISKQMARRWCQQYNERCDHVLDPPRPGWTSAATGENTKSAEKGIFAPLQTAMKHFFLMQDTHFFQHFLYLVGLNNKCMMFIVII
ncbi:hypothetical protein AVEN_243615-1 [Araneus ventricosus]|uniref:Mos1 transposase HTH domain-containing protein n=1 Tax=Araneus ventricosus TaxID=182803 RepID=A0A4Y2A681_ARAVE|nr:hypothetical protein AVEN_243615-1 [Araneus ventricosus]